MQFIVSKFAAYKAFNNLKDAKKYMRENKMFKISILDNGKLVGTILAQ